MTNPAMYFYILASVSWAASGEETNDMLAQFAADEKAWALGSGTEGSIVEPVDVKVEESGTLSSNTAGATVEPNTAHEKVEATGTLSSNPEGATFEPNTAHEKVEDTGTLSSDSEGVIVGQNSGHEEVDASGTLTADTHTVNLVHDAAWEESIKSLTDIARINMSELEQGHKEISVLQLNETIKPENGEKVPPFVGSFPGCQCTWEEAGGKWRCRGTIAYPPKVAGEKCCCCGLSCTPRNRCKNEFCLAIGIDQGPEIEAERKRWEELMKGADILIGENLPGFIVDLGQGHCDRNKIINKCKEKQLTPLCDHTSYSSAGQCYTPGLPGTPFHNRHFSHWGGHRQYFGIEDDYLFYGMCFYAAQQWALAPCNGNSHCWTNGNNALSPPSRVTSVHPLKQAHFHSNLINCNSDYKCWRTICVKEQPNKVR
jgi:hypothetical protein